MFIVSCFPLAFCDLVATTGIRIVLSWSYATCDERRSVVEKVFFFFFFFLSEYFKVYLFVCDNTTHGFLL